MNIKLTLIALLFIGFTACNNSGQQDQSSTETTDNPSEEVSAEATPLPEVPDGAKVFFKNLEDGQTVSSPVKVEMGVEGMDVKPAGDIEEGSGHHHILVDAGDSMEAGEVIPTDENHLHFGKGQTEAELELTPGEHEISLQFADGHHRSYGSQMAASIKINVK